MSNIPEGCKPFNLQEALEGKPVVTRDGRKVKIAGYNSEVNESSKLVGWCDGIAYAWSIDGFFLAGKSSAHDLFMAPETKDVFLLLWSIKGRDHISSVAFEDEDSAKKMQATIEYEGHVFHGIHKITITV